MPPAVAQCDTCTAKHGFRYVDVLWYQAMGRAMSEWNSEHGATPFIRALGGAAKYRGLCSACETGFHERAQRFEEDYRTTAPQFPL